MSSTGCNIGTRLLHESRLDGGYALLSLLITAVALAGAYFAYSKRDLYI